MLQANIVGDAMENLVDAVLENTPPAMDEGKTPHPHMDTLSTSFASRMMPSDSSRPERKRLGKTSWKLNRTVPDVGGIVQWTRSGYRVKNWNYYRLQKDNKWNEVALTGLTNWKYYWGPKMVQAANLMSDLDSYDQTAMNWSMKKDFVTKNRDDALQRTYARKNERVNLSKGSAWAQVQRAAAERLKCWEESWNDLEHLPKKALKQILTPTVLARDQEAVSAISKKLIEHEKREVLYKEYEKQRREDIRWDMKRREIWNDQLTEMAGQVPRPMPAPTHPSCATQWVCNLAQPKRKFVPNDIGSFSEFRGLVNVDHTKALDILHDVANQVYPEYDESIENKPSRSNDKMPTMEHIEGENPPPPRTYPNNEVFPIQRVNGEENEEQPPVTPTHFKSTAPGWEKTRAESADKRPRSFKENLPEFHPVKELGKSTLPRMGGNLQSHAQLPDMGLKRNKSVPYGSCCKTGFYEPHPNIKQLSRDMDDFDRKVGFSIGNAMLGNDFADKPQPRSQSQNKRTKGFSQQRPNSKNQAYYSADN